MVSQMRGILADSRIVFAHAEFGRTFHIGSRKRMIIVVTNEASKDAYLPNPRPPTYVAEIVASQSLIPQRNLGESRCDRRRTYVGRVCGSTSCRI